MSSHSVRLSARRIWEQKDGVNCCTSCAISTCLEAMRRDYDVLSPIFHYHRSGAPYQQGLTAIRALTLARSGGLPLYREHPHDTNLQGYRARPTPAAVWDALTRRLDTDTYLEPAFKRLRSYDLQHHIRNALTASSPSAVLLFIWPNSEYRDMTRSRKDTWDPVPGPRGSLHAVAIIGYDASTNRFIVQDSKGSDFGAGGQWYLRAEDCNSPMIYEAFALKKPQ